MNLNNSYVLRPRDLSAPERIAAEPFESRVAFARRAFSMEKVSFRIKGLSGAVLSWKWPWEAAVEAARVSSVPIS